MFGQELAWLMHEPALRELAGTFAAGPPADRQHNIARPQVSQQFGPIGVLEIVGTLLKAPTLADVWLDNAVSTVEIAAELQRMTGDESIAAILLFVDSPGGSALACGELFQRVADAAKRKPVWATIEGTAASGALYAAAPAARIVATRHSWVGSVGTYAPIVDTSGLADRLGVKIHVVRSGARKGDTTPGIAIDQATLADRQRIVDTLGQRFLDDLTTARRLTQGARTTVSSGAIFDAAEAQRLGLIDAIGDPEATLAEMRRRFNAQRVTSPSIASRATSPMMSAPTVAPVAVKVDPVQTFDQAVARKRAAGLLPAAAITAVVKENPALHREYLAEFNARIRVRR